MKEIFPIVDGWLADGKRVVLVGSVSGGCVEGAIVTEAMDVLASGVPKRCVFGYTDDQAFAVGLTCGGTVHVLVEPLEP